MDGGYDRGYASCPCFWGREPGSLVVMLTRLLGTFDGLSVLDAGCGEGKNAAHFAARGARVVAVDISELAINHAASLWPLDLPITWRSADIREFCAPHCAYDIVLAYGLMHCLPSMDEVAETVAKLQEATKPHGFNILVALNNRHQELSKAHPELKPCLLEHNAYMGFYETWGLLHVSDSDLRESHPHNNIWHTHSITRILARKK